MFTHNKKYMGKGMYLLNKKFIRKRIEEISGTDKYCHNDWHTFPYSEAEESIVRVSGVDPDIVCNVINSWSYTEDEDFVKSVAEALNAKVEGVATPVKDGKEHSAKPLSVSFSWHMAFCDKKRIGEWGLAEDVG